MPHQRTLEKAELDIKNSNLGKARDRYLGLLLTYPDDLSLREKLGSIYWKLQYPGMAGKYWYLEEEKTPEMKSACETFEKQMGDDPLKILLALKFRGDVQKIEGRYSGKILLDLQKRAKKKHPYIRDIDFPNKGARKPTAEEHKPKSNSSAGCWAIMLASFGLMVFGLIAIVIWTIQLVGR